MSIAYRRGFVIRLLDVIYLKLNLKLRFICKNATSLLKKKKQLSIRQSNIVNPHYNDTASVPCAHNTMIFLVLK